jgi:hypothetical protein
MRDRHGDARSVDWHSVEDEIAERLADGSLRVEGGTIYRINQEVYTC